LAEANEIRLQLAHAEPTAAKNISNEQVVTIKRFMCCNLRYLASRQTFFQAGRAAGWNAREGEAAVSFNGSAGAQLFGAAA
jgi:hypothetical protein